MGQCITFGRKQQILNSLNRSMFMTFGRKQLILSSLSWSMSMTFGRKHRILSSFSGSMSLTSGAKTLGQICSCGSSTGPNLLLHLHGGPFHYPGALWQYPPGTSAPDPRNRSEECVGFGASFSRPWQWEATAVPTMPPLFLGCGHKFEDAFEEYLTAIRPSPLDIG